MRAVNGRQERPSWVAFGGGLTRVRAGEIVVVVGSGWSGLQLGRHTPLLIPPPGIECADSITKQMPSAMSTGTSS
jgi:hypothetical protein